MAVFYRVMKWPCIPHSLKLLLPSAQKFAAMRWVVLNHAAYMVFNFKIQLNRCSNIIFYLRTFHDKIKEWACNLFVSFTVSWIALLRYSHELSFPQAIRIHYDSKNEELLKRCMHSYYCWKKESFLQSFELLSVWFV